MWQFLWSKLSMKIDILQTFWPSKLKEGQFLAKKSEKVYFFRSNQKVYKMKKYCFPKWLRCTKKKRFLAVFVIFPKSQKQPKNNVFFWNVEIFWHTIIIWENSTFSFWTLFMRISQIWCNPLRAHHFPQLFCLYQKVPQILMYGQSFIKH